MPHRLKKISREGEKSILLVWLLNLIPYSGLGLLYAFGVPALPYLFFFWIFEAVMGPKLPHLAVYFAISILGSMGVAMARSFSTIARQNDAMVDETLKRFIQAEPDQNSSLDLLNSESIVETLDRKAKGPDRAARKPARESAAAWLASQREVSGGSGDEDEDDDSDYALTSFAEKARRAEESLRAATQLNDHLDNALNDLGESAGESDVQPYAVPEARDSGKLDVSVPSYESAVEDPVKLDASIPSYAESVQDPVKLDANIPSYAEAVEGPVKSPSGVSYAALSESSTAESTGADALSAVAAQTSPGAETSSTHSPSSSEISGSSGGFDNFTLPKFELPTFDIPSFDSSKFDYTFHSDTPRSDLTNSGTTDSKMSTASGSGASAVEPRCPQCGKAKDENFSFCLSCGHAFGSSA